MKKFYLFPLLCLLTFLTAEVVAQVAYVPNNAGSDNNLTVVNIATGVIIANIPVGTAPAGVAINENTERAYITNELSSSVSVINTTDNTEITAIGVADKPYGIALSADGTKAYLAHINGDIVTVINTVTNTVITTIQVGNSPRGVTLSPDGSKIYVANAASDDISVIDPTTDVVTATIAVGNTPTEVIISPDNATLYVTNRQDGNISVIDAATGVTTAIIPTTGSNPYNMAITADGTTLYVSLSFGNSTVDVIDLTTNTVTSTITVGGTPTGIEITPDGSRVVVANFGSNSLSVIDIATNTVTMTIDSINNAFGLGNFIFGNATPVALPGDECNDAYDINSLLGQAQNVPQTSQLYDNREYTSMSDPDNGFDCFGEVMTGIGEALLHTVWYTFTGDGNLYNFKTVECNATTYVLEGNTQAAFYSGTCDNLTPVDCFENGENDVFNNIDIDIQTETGVEYFLMIDNRNDFIDGPGEFCLEVTNLGTVGITDLVNTDFRIFPNPTTGLVQLPQIDLDRVEAYDATGRLVLTQQQPGTRIDLSAQPTGLYVLKLYSSEEVYSAKVVKK